MKLAAAEMDRVLILEEFTSIGSPLVKLEEALEEKLEEQKKTQAAIRSSYDNEIRILRGKIRRLRGPVDIMQAQLETDTKNIDNIKKNIETIKSQISPEAVTGRKLLVQLKTVAFELVGAHPQAYFGGTTLIEKDCERICRHREDFTRSIQRGLENLVRQWLQLGPKS